MATKRLEQLLVDFDKHAGAGRQPPLGWRARAAGEAVMLLKKLGRPSEPFHPSGSLEFGPGGHGAGLVGRRGLKIRDHKYLAHLADQVQLQRAMAAQRPDMIRWSQARAVASEELEALLRVMAVAAQMPPARGRSARQIAASLKKRANEYHHHRISYEALGAGNKKDWAEAERDPALMAEVSALLR